MPELPEVETTRVGIGPHVIGRQVKAVVVRESRLRWPIDPGLPQYLKGQFIESVGRRAKYLLLSTSAGRLMIHLGMSGSLRVTTHDVNPETHDHVDIVFDQTCLRYRDPRRFGSIFWLPGEESHPLLDHLGPEPLTEALNGDYLHKMSRGRRGPVKAFIMNADVVVGVGNIYANESLYKAGIHPARAAGAISAKRYERLSACIKETLNAAIDAGGTSLRDFVREDGAPGYFSQALEVYGRAGEPCGQCGKALKEIRQSGRTTVFCAGCQR
ncbi:MAG: bifunctional DNA-formamidopyrimidine glycosylase/DNA-(apurinic or apyrimidinic site) lyase [Pseudomonadales bacterium]|nr:bifunctional DNA-formamidopyrimidine glycosylase/DNA-(apurinic or apyrimidinic site) lyase [Pseudomonadales bacterium]